MLEGNYFEELYKVDVREKTKKKNGLNYLSWATAWAKIKEVYPDATYKVYEEEITVVDTLHNEDGSEREITKSIHRPWFDDGNTGWVQTSVTVNGIEYIDQRPILNYSNKAIEADSITSADANTAIQRSLVRAIGKHGLGLYLFEGEDLPQELKETETLQSDCMDLIKKKCALSEKTKTKVGQLCKEVLEDDSGDPMACDDVEKLRALKKKLLTVRKVA